MRCSICEEKIQICDNCESSYNKGDRVICCDDSDANHFCCGDCYCKFYNIEEGEVE